MTVYCAVLQTMRKFGDFDKQTNGLTQLPVYERGGMIFTVLEPGEDEVDFDDFLGGVMEDIGRLGYGKLAFLWPAQN